MSDNHSKVVVDHEGDLSSSQKTILFLGFLLEADLLLELEMFRTALLKSVRVVAMSRRERMVAHDIADAPCLLAVMVRRRTFFQENSSILSVMM